MRDIALCLRWFVALILRGTRHGKMPEPLQDRGINTPIDAAHGARKPARLSQSQSPSM